MFVYKKYDQDSLNLQYNNRFYVPGFAGHFNTWELLSRQAEEQYACFENIPYGELPGECLDIYASEQPNSKTLVFVHGGYWQSMDKSSFHFIASAFLPLNITTIIINYPLAPVFSMDQMVQSCLKLGTWLQLQLSKYNGDIYDLYLAGHSAGGHLVAMMMEGEHADLFKGACSLSGIFNLIPIQLSNINQVIKMSKEEAIRNSPITTITSNKSPFILFVGEHETQEFKDQSREYYLHRKKFGLPTQLLELPGLNHFSIVEALQDSTTNLCQALLRLMKITNQ